MAIAADRYEKARLGSTGERLWRTVGPNAASILRRYEFYKYSGEYDPETHEAFATFSDSHPNDPNGPSNYYDPTMTLDLGNYLGAQNAAVIWLRRRFRNPKPMPCCSSALVWWVSWCVAESATRTDPGSVMHHQRGLRSPFYIEAGETAGRETLRQGLAMT